MKYNPNEEAIAKKVGENFRTLLSKKGKKQVDVYAHTISKVCKGEVSDWYNGKKIMTSKKATILKNELEWCSDVSILYLMGYDSYMTEEERELCKNNKIEKTFLEYDYMTASVILLLRASGYTVKTYFEEGLTQKGDVNKILDEIKNYCIISKNGKSITLNIGQLHDFSNLICDYTEFMIERM